MAFQEIIVSALVFILHLAGGQGQPQSDVSYVPVNTIPSSDGLNTGTCPTTEQRTTTYTELLNEVDDILLQHVNDGRPCNGPEWRRIAFLNMTDPEEQCPEVLLETPYSKRTCGRYGHEPNCWSITYPNTDGTQYSQVCGRVKAYQWGRSLAFTAYYRDTRGIDLERVYLDGVSITHGSPGARQHVWSFAIGFFDGPGDVNCPCSPDAHNTFPPPFIRNDYFCESGATFDTRRGIPSPFHQDDLLWDGRDCHERPEDQSTCCTFNTPPWFKKVLPNPTTDGIEFRLCCSELASSHDIALELLEIYVQ